MSEAKKVSFNQETAASTERHNDRSLYQRGYENRDRNVHWDMYGCGSSFEAEARYYDETFGEVLQAQNERAIEMRKYERVMDMPTWHAKHPPKECIVQLGNVDNNDDVKDYAIEAAAKMKERIESLGGIVISWDVHDDEETEAEDGSTIQGTPHLHMRYLFLVHDENGLPKIDMKNALLQHGVEPPDPTKKIDRRNNPAQVFLDDCREMLEDFADEYEAERGNPPVERIHQKRAHESVSVYKAKKRAADAEKRAAAAEQREAEAVARVEAMRQTLDDAIADRDAAIAERDAVIQERDEARIECNKMRAVRDALAGESYRAKGGKTVLGVAGLRKEQAKLGERIEAMKGEYYIDEDGAQSVGLAGLKEDIEKYRGLADSEVERFRRNREAADSANEYHMEDWLAARVEGNVRDSAFDETMKRVGRLLLAKFRQWREKVLATFAEAQDEGASTKTRSEEWEYGD